MANEVRIVLKAESAAALAEIQKFAKGITDSFATIKAGDATLTTASSRVQTFGAATTQATGSVKDFTAQMSLIPGPVGQAASAVQSLTGFLAGPAGLAAGAAAAVGGLVTLASQFSAEIERLDNLASTTGLSVQALQSFEQAAKEAGEPAEGLARGFAKISEAVAETIKGNEAAGKSFAAIGIDLKAMVAGGASAEQILEAVAHALGTIADPTRRAALQMDIFGVKGRAINAVLQAIRDEGLPGYIKKMEDAGIVTSTAANEAAVKWDEATDRIGRAFKGILNEVQGVAAQMVIAVMNAAASAQRGIEALRKQAGPGTGAEGFGVGVEGITVEGGGAGMGGAAGFGAEMGGEAGSAFRKAFTSALEQPPPFPFLAPGDVSGIMSPDTLRQIEDGAVAVDALVTSMGEYLQATDTLIEANRDLGTGLDLVTTKSVGGLTVGLDTLGDTAGATKQIWVQWLASFGGGWEQVTVPVEKATGAVDEFTLTLGTTLPHAYSVVTPEAKKFDDLIIKLQGDLGGIDEHLAADIPHVRQSFTELERLGHHAAQALEAAFSEGLFDVMTGRFDELGKTFSRLVEDWQRMLSDFIVRDLGKLFNVAGAGGTSAIGGMFSEIADKLKESGGDLIGAFQNLSAQSLQTAQALGIAAGSAVGGMAAGAVFGPGQAEKMGSAIGGVVVGAVGAYFGGPGGALIGAAVGSFIGGAIGSLFDSEDDPRIEAFRDGLRNAATKSFTAGIVTAIQSNDIEAGWDVFRQGIKEAVLSAVIEAMVQNVFIDVLTKPLAEAIGQAVHSGLGPEEMAATLGPFIDAFKAGFADLRPFFDMIFNTLRDDIIPAIDSIGDKTDRVGHAQKTVTDEVGHTHQKLLDVAETLSNTQTDGMEPLITQTQSWRDGFEETNTKVLDLYDSLTTINDEPMADIVQSTEGWVGVLQSAEGVAHSVAERLNEIPREISVTITENRVSGGEGGPGPGGDSGGLQHGGLVLAPRMRAILHGPEFVVPARLDYLKVLGGAIASAGGATGPDPQMEAQNALLRELIHAVRDAARRRIPAGNVTT